MKIRLSDIAKDGLTVKDSIPLAPLNQRIVEGRDIGVRFIEPPLVNVQFFPTPDGAFCQGTVTGKYTQACSFCLDDIPQEVTLRTDFLFKPKPAVTEELSQEEEESYVDDVGLIYFEGEHIEFEEVAQETLILSLSLYWRPPVEADGKCSVCHRDEKPISDAVGGSFSLGSILKAKGIAK